MNMQLYEQKSKDCWWLALKKTKEWKKESANSSSFIFFQSEKPG